MIPLKVRRLPSVIRVSPSAPKLQKNAALPQLGNELNLWLRDVVNYTGRLRICESFGMAGRSPNGRVQFKFEERGPILGSTGCALG